MKLKPILFILFIINIVLFNYGCKKNVPYSKVAPSIYGTNWVRNYPAFTIQLVFNYDDTYSFIKAGKVYESGTYTTSYSSLTLQTTEGDCNGIPAAYNYVIADAKIIFLISKDSCTDRSNELKGTWIK
ncbi:MAG: hypothetical protein H7296_10690 [Bacteroidia bacterium]|nr:hypothetical protein [Bacteroidia bacterium]